MKFPKLVIEEAKALKKYATKEELNKLNFNELNPESKVSCIYGQMTGDCFSPRASELIEKSCARVYVNKVKDDICNVGTNKILNGSPKKLSKCYGRLGVWYSPIEVFISRAVYNRKDELNKKLIQFLKGEIKTL